MRDYAPKGWLTQRWADTLAFWSRQLSWIDLIYIVIIVLAFVAGIWGGPRHG